jgi:glycosyltransferase involved in cell wall biosynthesis
MGVTLFTTCFGSYGRFLPGWLDAAAESGADDVLVVSDILRPVPNGVRLVVASTKAVYRESGFRNIACKHGREDWLWQIDVDDRIVPGATRMVEGVSADILQVGYRRSDGFVYVPQAISNERYLRCGDNPYVSGSPFRRSLLDKVQFPDVAWSDWGFWRLAARASAVFSAAGEVAYEYRWEPDDSVTGLYWDPQHVKDVLAL